MRWTKIRPEGSIQLFATLYLAAFLAGALAASQLWKKEDFREYLSLYAILEQNKSTWQDIKKYVLFLLREKGVFAAVCIIAGLAGAGEIMAVLSALWLGFLGGVLATVFLLQAGLEGFLFCMAGILSQLLFYIPAVILFLLIMGKQRRMIPRRRHVPGGNQKRALYLSDFPVCHGSWYPGRNLCKLKSANGYFFVKKILFCFYKMW